MDPALLSDPGFWHDSEPFVAGKFPGQIPSVPALRKHVLFQTSGSSGAPKWIALSKQALLLSAAAVNRHLDVDCNSHWCLALPVHHVGGFGVVARAYEAACSLSVYSERWNALSFAQFACRKRITHLSLVPTQVHDLVTAKAKAPDSLVAVVVGGGRLADDLGNAARALGWPVVASYGMTEAASQVATQRPPSRAEIYHHAPIPLLPIWSAMVGDDQRLQLSGPALFSGQLISQDKEWIYQPRTGDCFLTSDRVELQQEQITPLGRADTLVKIMGELVDPGAIEDQLVTLSRGQLKPSHFCLVPVVDRRAEHRLIAVIGAEVDANLINSLCWNYNESAIGPKRVAAWVRLPHLPVSGIGKVRRSEVLRQLEGREAEFMDCQPHPGGDS